MWLMKRKESQRRMNKMRLISHLSSFGLAIILLVLASFSVWAAMSTLDAATRAKAAVHLSDLYEQAHYAVGAEESLERKYRLEPGPEALANHRAAAAMLVNVLQIVDRDGDTSDR